MLLKLRMIVEGGIKTTVVFFVGGCTYTEIAALRWVGRQNRGIVPCLSFNVYMTKLMLGRKLLIATTGIISGASLVENIANLGKVVGTSIQ